MTDLVTVAAIEEAADILRSVAIRTPLVRAPWLEEVVGAEVRLKCENLQRIGAFKFRGAYVMIAKLPEMARRRGVVAYSAGNHAQGVALAAHLFGIPATVVMPTNVSEAKLRGVKRWGAKVVLAGTTGGDRQLRAEEIASSQSYVIIPPFDHPDVIAGQGTIGLEILEDWADVDTILVPVGGGGALSGIAACVKRLKPECQVVGLEPERGGPMGPSLRAAELVTVANLDTIADGLRIERVCDLTLTHTMLLADGVIDVPDRDIVFATSQLLQTGKLVVEPSGAIGVAALLSGLWRPEGRRTAIVLSGGNLDRAYAAELWAMEPNNDAMSQLRASRQTL